MRTWILAAAPFILMTGAWLITVAISTRRMELRDRQRQRREAEEELAGGKPC